MSNRSLAVCILGLAGLAAGIYLIRWHFPEQDSDHALYHEPVSPGTHKAPAPESSDARISGFNSLLDKEFPEELETVVPVTIAQKLSEVDPDWAKFLRTDHKLSWKLAQAPLTLRSEHTYRDKILNPFDKYIPPPRRKQIESIIAQGVPRLRKIKRYIAKIRMQEVDTALAKGKAVRISDEPRDPAFEARLDKHIESYKHHAARIAKLSGAQLPDMTPAWEERERKTRRQSLAANYKPGTVDGVLHRRGESFGVSNKDLPVSVDLKRMVKALYASFAVSLVNYYVDAEILPPGHAERCLVEFEEFLFNPEVAAEKARRRNERLREKRRKQR